MKSSPILHALIRSMSATEKQYFVKFLLLRSSKQTKQDSIFLDLFKAIASMKTYDDEALRKRFNKRITTQRSFITLKSGLKELLLDSLLAYGTANSEAAGYRRKLGHAEILAVKHLDKEALHVLRQQKKEVLKRSFSKGNNYIADIILVESWLIERCDSTNVIAIQQLMCENKENSHEMYLSHHLLYNSTRLSIMVMNSLGLRSTKDMEEFSAIKAEMELWLRVDEDNEPFNRFIYLTDAKANLALLEGNLEGYHSYTYKMWVRFSAPAEVEQFIERGSLVFFAGAFINAARGCVLARKKGLLREMIERATPVYTEHFAADAFHYSYFLYFQLMVAFHEGNRDKTGLHLQPLLELPLWQQESGNIMQHRTIATGIAMAFHASGDARNASKWANKCMVHGQNKTAELIAFEFCGLFRFMVEYERISAVEAIENERMAFVTQAETYYDVLRKQHEKDFRFSELILRFLIKAMQADEKERVRTLARSLQTDMSKLKDTPNVKQFYGLFDFEAWVKAQTQAKA